MNGLDQPLLAQMAQLTLTRVGRAVVVVAEIPRGHDPKRPDDRERP